MVAQRNDGTYDVAYDDGDAEGGVEASARGSRKRCVRPRAKEVKRSARRLLSSPSRAKGERSSASRRRTPGAHLVVILQTYEGREKVDQICESIAPTTESNCVPTATSLLLLCACRSELTTTAKTLVEKCDALVSEEQADGLSALKVARSRGAERFLKKIM